jgi:hypothetical protein
VKVEVKPLNWPVKVKKGNGSDLAVSFYQRDDDERSE